MLPSKSSWSDAAAVPVILVAGHPRAGERRYWPARLRLAVPPPKPMAQKPPRQSPGGGGALPKGPVAKVPSRHSLPCCLIHLMNQLRQNSHVQMPM
jgi:hypothetical protein